jgi:hypothetical protein
VTRYGLCLTIDSYRSQWIAIGLALFVQGKSNYKSHFFLFPYFQHGCIYLSDGEKGVLSALVTMCAIR